MVSIERRKLGPYSVQSVGAAEAVSCAIGHNPGQGTTPMQETQMLPPEVMAHTFMNRPACELSSLGLIPYLTIHCDLDALQAAHCISDGVHHPWDATST